jgi:NitT/TauT family transport system permease protein
MVILVLLIDQFFWKPLVTLADRYKLELSAGEERRFWVVDLWRAASLPALFKRIFGPSVFALDRMFSNFTKVKPQAERKSTSKTADMVFNVIVSMLAIAMLVAAIRFILHPSASGLFPQYPGTRCIACHSVKNKTGTAQF